MRLPCFSPRLVKDGTTENALRLVLDRTSFRIRVLTKNGVVGSPKWLEFFLQHPGRFVVGLSIGTLNDEWAKRVELFTSVPSARIRALHNLQDAGVPTYGMLCPVFPHVSESDQLELLTEAIRPDLVETIWAEPYNDRKNWPKLREKLRVSDFDRGWLEDVYQSKNRGRWSRYATDLYVRLKRKAKSQGWLGKLRYLLYESAITQADAQKFVGLDGVMLQATPGDDGRSRNPHMAALQTDNGG